MIKVRLNPDEYFEYWLKNKKLADEMYSLSDPDDELDEDAAYALFHHVVDNKDGVCYPLIDRGRGGMLLFVDEHRMVVNDVFVNEEHRCQGVFKGLLEEAKNIALNAGVHRIEIGVMGENVVAQKCYAKSGFKVESMQMSLKI